jgi:hypothetical protein
MAVLDRTGVVRTASLFATVSPATVDVGVVADSIAAISAPTQANFISHLLPIKFATAGTAGTKTNGVISTGTNLSNELNWRRRRPPVRDVGNAGSQVSDIGDISS